MVTASPWRRPHRTTTAAVVAVVLLVAFEAYAVVTAMPVAARALGGLREYGLAFSLFVTAALLGIVVAGDVVDRRGPAPVMVAGLVAFGAGLLISGTADGFVVFLAGRALSGLGGGVHMVCMYVLVAAAYPESLQPKVFGLISASWVLPSLIGPPIAGLLATQIGWRAPFLAVLPLLPAPLWVLASRLRTVRVAPPVADQPFDDTPDGEPVAVPRRRTMLHGVLLAGGAGGVQWALHAAASPAALGDGPLVVVAAVLGSIVMLVGLVRLMPAGVFRLARGLPALVVYRTAVNAAFFGSEAFLTLMLVEQRGVSPALAGMALTCGALGWFSGSWSQGHWPGGGPDRYRLLVIGGLLIGLALAALTLTPRAGVPVVVAAPVWAVAGLGMGWAMSCSSVLLLRLSPAGESGRSAAAVQIGDNLGSMLGIGLSGAVFAAGHDANGDDIGVYMLIWGALAVVGALSGWAGIRVRPAAPGPSTTSLSTPDAAAPGGGRSR